MTSSITARVGRLLSASAAAFLASASIAAADVPTRGEVQYLVNQAAHYWLIDAENHLLTVERLRLPRGERDLGKACGAILKVGSPRLDTGMQSYTANLSIDDGDLRVTSVTGFFMPVEKLLNESICD